MPTSSAARASGKLRQEDLEGGTFTISNLGMYGVEQFVAVLNPPQVAILAVGATEEQPVVRDGDLEILPLMTLTLTCDHRALDGAVASEFLGTLRALPRGARARAVTPAVWYRVRELDRGRAFYREQLGFEELSFDAGNRGLAHAPRRHGDRDRRGRAGGGRRRARRRRGREGRGECGSTRPASRSASWSSCTGRCGSWTSSTRTATASSLRKSFPGTDVAAAVGAPAVSAEPVAGGGYGTNTAKWRVELADGRRAFVKLALDDGAADWLRAEHRVYAQVDERFLPTLLGWRDAGGRTLLVLEDLAHAHWPPPWSRAMVERGPRRPSTPSMPPRRRPDLPVLEDARERLDGWPLVAADPGPLLATGVCSAAWLEAALPVLSHASAAAELAGRSLVHLDVRSDNLCLDGERVVLVDWNLACVGNPLVDVVRVAPEPPPRGWPGAVGDRPRQPRPRGADRRLLRVACRRASAGDRADRPRVPAAAGRDRASLGGPRARPRP